MSITQTRMALIFDEWAKRYAENPEEFNSVLNADGNPSESYGESCALYFEQIAREMDADNGQFSEPTKTATPTPDPAKNCDV